MDILDLEILSNAHKIYSSLQAPQIKKVPMSFVNSECQLTSVNKLFCGNSYTNCDNRWNFVTFDNSLYNTGSINFSVHMHTHVRMCTHTHSHDYKLITDMHTMTWVQ